MAPQKRWLNLLLWGLGDRLVGLKDYRSNLLLIVNLMTWYGLLSLTLPQGGVDTFLLGWFFFPALGLNPAYWVGTQIAVGLALTWHKEPPGAQVQQKQEEEEGKQPPMRRPTKDDENQEEEKRKQQPLGSEEP